MSCENHKKDVAGISDMKELAEMIGDLHYESLAEFCTNLAIKLHKDGTKDLNHGRITLGALLREAAFKMRSVSDHMRSVWQLSKPFMPA